MRSRVRRRYGLSGMSTVEQYVQSATRSLEYLEALRERPRVDVRWTGIAVVVVLAAVLGVCGILVHHAVEVSREVSRRCPEANRF